MIQMWLLTRKFGFDPRLKWISSVAGISNILCTSEVASATRTLDICGWAQTFRAWCVMKDRKMCGFN